MITLIPAPSMQIYKNHEQKKQCGIASESQAFRIPSFARSVDPPNIILFLRLSHAFIMPSCIISPKSSYFGGAEMADQVTPHPVHTS